MEPKFILDEQISHLVADILKRARVDCRAVSGSGLAGRDDRTILREAIREGRVLVTYDIADFVIVFREMLSEALDVPGIVFVNARTISIFEIRKLARALCRLTARIQGGEVNPAGGVFLSAD